MAPDSLAVVVLVVPPERLRRSHPATHPPPLLPRLLPASESGPVGDEASAKGRRQQWRRKQQSPWRQD
ncbi:unnamed protein product [Protopolystoma xenopodis]|uniref:Uncharacterized protein n=1 Tax=Protopolystoma xenopodis TaxID=117903 RepID=A0A3S5BUB3_9PLAT|nr:unnamed protein product [Protopolystoma xenopodis]